MQFFHTWICLCLPEVLSCDYKVVACLLLIVERCSLGAWARTRRQLGRTHQVFDVSPHVTLMVLFTLQLSIVLGIGLIVVLGLAMRFGAGIFTSGRPPICSTCLLYLKMGDTLLNGLMVGDCSKRLCPRFKILGLLQPLG
jgi:hypothetical protein